MPQTSKKGIKTYDITCNGVSPMLQNPMTDEVLDELLGGKSARKGAVTDLPKDERAKRKLCVSASGEYGFPATYLFASLVSAGRFVQYEGKKKISTLTESLMPAFLTIVPPSLTESGDGFIPFIDQKAPWVVDMRRGVLAANKAAVAIVRPKFKDWAFNVRIEVDLDQIAIDKIEDLFAVAGRQCGLGDFRPSKRGPFGRFEVAKFAEAEALEERKAA